MLKKIYQEWVRPLGRDAIRIALDALFPVHCVICGAASQFVCNGCRATLRRADFQSCIACKKPSLYGVTHSGCATSHAPDGMISLFDYRDPAVAEIIIQGKYHLLPGVFRELGQMAAAEIDCRHPHLLGTEEPYILVPLPLHPARLRWRGFNQAAIVAGQLADILGLVAANPLLRCRATRTQKDLSREARMRNVRNAFQLARHAAVRDKKFILVDDVITTGATLLEAAKVLKRNGAKSVWCVTLATD